MTPVQILFSFEGRLNRQPYWLSRLAFILFGTLFEPRGPMILISLIFLWISLALETKRWHDNGKSGWWTLFHLSASILFWATINGYTFGDYRGLIITGLEMIILSVSGLVIIWFFVELGILPGTPGPNKYGPDPTQLAPIADQL